MNLSLPLRRHIVLLVFVFNVYGLQSCSTTHIVSKYDSDTFANNPANKRTTWTYAWGLVQPKDINPKCDSRLNHMNKVTIKNNLAYSLLYVVTLGIVMPQRVEWVCAPYTPPTGTLGNNQ